MAENSAMVRAVLAASVAICMCQSALAQQTMRPPAPPPAPPNTDKGTCPAPIWPKSSLRNEETGTVTLTYLVGADGRVIENKVLRSSGHLLLDEAALQNNRGCRFTPLPAGAAPQWRSMQLVWTLKDAPAGAGAGVPPPAGEYFRDLGRVLGQIRAVDWTRDICASNQDGDREMNLKAVNDWKAAHRAVIDEVETAFQGLPAYWRQSDAASAKAGPALWEKINGQLDQGRDMLARQYASQLGKERFALVCANFPTLLKGDAFDIEKRYASELVSIRRGPKQF